MNEQVHTFGGELERQKAEAVRWRLWYEKKFATALDVATPEEDLRGVDFWDIGLFGRRSLQLKIDFQSDKYHNFFLERWIEDDYGRRPGWSEKMDADEFWFVQPVHNHAVCVPREDMLVLYAAAKERQELRGPVHNRDPLTGRTWRAYGYPVKVARFVAAGSHFDLPAPYFSEAGAG